ncbi:MAG: ERF family protein [Desulfobulbaceae bacterium]|nr:ERF family protein [Desulfobulbaceae bacterium]
MSIHKELARIQKELKTPKSQYNKFGKYNYRNCEDILEAVKPLLGELVLTLSDKVEAIGGNVYITATAKIFDGENSIEVSASAREAVTKKGMDDSQITGTSSSYARKYALNGLFCIDDTKDADAMDTNGNQSGFIVDATAQGWIASVKQDNTVLDQIIDPAYKEFIKTNAGV